MTTVCMKQWLTSMLLIVMVAGCTGSSGSEADLAVHTPGKATPMPYYNQADFTPEWIGAEAQAYDSIHTIKKFSFTDQNGETVTNRSLQGRIYVANFFFTICPSICTKMTSNLEMVYNEYKGDPEVKFLSHSVMPWVDSVHVLRRYADLRGLNSGQWHFVTGDKDQIYTLARQSYFAEKEIGLDKETDEFLHTENFILVDGKGRIRGVYNGTIPLEMKRLSQDIATLKIAG